MSCPNLNGIQRIRIAAGAGIVTLECERESVLGTLNFVANGHGGAKCKAKSFFFRDQSALCFESICKV